VEGGSARGKIGRGTWEARGGAKTAEGNKYLEVGPWRESDRPIVAGKRVMTVERRGLSEGTLMEERGKAAWMTIPLRKN